MVALKVLGASDLEAIENPLDRLDDIRYDARCTPVIHLKTCGCFR